MYDIAVVGSGGFLGAAIERNLVGRGHRVAPVTRRMPVHVGGVVSRVVAGATGVVWAAGGVSPTVAHQQPALVEEELEAFTTSLRALADQPAPPHVVLLSSGGAVYGGGMPPHAESAPLIPGNAYGAYKLHQEQILQSSGLAYTSLRISNAYGPGQTGARGQGVLAVWMKAVLAGQAIQIHGSGAVARDYVYVDDVADAVSRVIETPRLPQTLNIGSGVPTSLDELARRLSAVAGMPVRIDRRPSRGVDPSSTWLNTALAAQALGWRPRVELADGLEQMWRWMRQA